MSFHKSENKYYGYIYKITNKVNNKIYIGQTRRTIQIRFKQHILESKNEDTHTILYLAFKKYGIENFVVEKIKEYSFEDKDELISALNRDEIFYISEYNSLSPNGYNMQLGGKSPTESLKCAVNQYSINGEFICSYNSCSDAAEGLGLPSYTSHISECCKGNLHSAYGFVWRYKGDSFDKYSDKKDKRIRRVNVYDLNNVFLGTYQTIKDAMIDVLGFYSSAKSSHVCGCCKGNRHKAYGYIWKYAD